MVERRKDQQREDVHHKMGVTSNAQKTKKKCHWLTHSGTHQKEKGRSCYNAFVHEIIRQCTSLSLSAEKHYHYQRKQVLVVDTHKSRKVACSYYLLPLAFTEDVADNQKSICLLYELKVSHESSLLDLLLAFRCLNTTSCNSCSGSSCWQWLSLPVNAFFSQGIKGCTTSEAEAPPEQNPC